MAQRALPRACRVGRVEVQHNGAPHRGSYTHLDTPTRRRAHAPHRRRRVTTSCATALSVDPPLLDTLDADREGAACTVAAVTTVLLERRAAAEALSIDDETDDALQRCVFTAARVVR